MTDDRDLRALARDLLADPPHPAPPLDELERRVARRRQRRARAIGVASVLAVVLVAGAVVAIPRDAELRAGDDTAQPDPPPMAPNPVELVVMPQSASADTPRSIVQRNTGSQTYDACGKSFDLFRWDGLEWQALAAAYVPPGGELVLGDFDPTAATRSMEMAQCAIGSSVAPGADVAVGGFQPSRPWRQAPDGATPLRGDALGEGWYELRQLYVYDDNEPSVGRFEITPPGPATGPPAFEPGPVQLVVSPESAPLEADRSIEIRNDGTEPYFSCLGYNLFRWSGVGWEPAARLYLPPADHDEPPQLAEYEPTPPVADCGVTTVAAGSATTLPFRPGAATWYRPDGTTPPRTEALANGWYELREVVPATEEPSSGLGRFRIGPGVSAPSDAAPMTTVATNAPGIQGCERAPCQPSDNIGGISVEGSVDVWPGGPGVLVGELLPDEMIAIDDETIALAWPGPCNRPAERLDVTANATEVEVRLHVTTTLEVCADDAPDRWVLTTDLGGIRIGTRRLVARAAGSDREVEVPAPASIRASVPLVEIPAFPGSTPISFQVPSDFLGGAALLTVPAPLLTSDHACAVATVEIDGTFVPVVRMGAPVGEPDFASCTTSAAIMIEPADRLFGAG